MVTRSVSTPIFVGRCEELKQFDEILRDPGPRVVLVVGPPGMGKTMLIEEMMQRAHNHPELQCGAVRYEVAPTDTVDSILELMLDHAYDAAAKSEGSFAPTDRRRKQWRALFETVVPKGDKLVELALSLKRDPAKNTRDQFIDRIAIVANTLASNGRAVFVIDPEKYVPRDSDQAWAIVARRLPTKVKLIFAQRPDDALVNSQPLNSLENLVKIPGKGLDALDESAVDELVSRRAADVGHPQDVLRDAVAPYEGHPYAVAAALDLIQAGTPPDKLPLDPGGIAEEQWKKVCQIDERAIALFEAYAILEVAVPDEIVEAVTGLDSRKRRNLLARPFLTGLLRDEAEGRRIYHALLGDYIRNQIEPADAAEYHRRAIETYRARLGAEMKPDALAAKRLPEHVLATEGEGAFVVCFVDECGELLRSLGLYDACVALSEQGLGIVQPGSAEKAALIGNLGLICRDRGDLNGAEDRHREALAIHRRLGLGAGAAADYGNLGVIYRMRGNLGLAEDMHNKARKICQELGRPQSMADQCSSLGIVYRMRAELDHAEEMHMEALHIYQSLDLPAGTAQEYTNLAAVCQSRGDTDKAEHLEQNALAIHMKIGHRRGMAASYGNLGLIYRRRGDLDKAESMHLKALEITQELRCWDAIANQYAGLALVLLIRGELDKAEEMLLKALAVHQQVGHRPGMAADYDYLGIICKARADIAGARTNWRQARDLYADMGMRHRAEHVQHLLDALSKEDRTQ